MRAVATLTATGVLGLIVLEALKILLAPVAMWLLGVVMMAVKVLLVTAGIAVVLALAIWAYRHWSKDGDEVVV